MVISKNETTKNIKNKNKTTILLVILIVAIVVTLTTLGIVFKTRSANINRKMGIEDMTPGVISKEADTTKKSVYIGCLADTDNDGTVDGVVFADLLEGWSGQNYSGKWNDSDDGVYEITDAQKVTAAQVKDYYLEIEDGTTPVLKAIGEGAERFYVMSLKDFLVTIKKGEDIRRYSSYSWYDAANGLIGENETELEFGTGKANTNTMISLWNNATYGAQNESNGGFPDIWSVIQEEVQKGWFVPSASEWAAFGDAFSITSAFTSVYGLYGAYWTSSIDSKNEYNTYAWRFSSSQGTLKQDYSLSYTLSIRLATIF